MSARPSAAALAALIGDRNRTLTSRWDAADAMDILDVWTAEEILEQKDFLIHLLRALTGKSKLDEVDPGHEVGERLSRAAMHLNGPPPPDYRAIREHLLAAVNGIETATR